MSLIECPECGNKFFHQAKRCSCGWRQLALTPVQIDHQCQYATQQRRCPLPGTISPYLHSNSMWYCTLHWRTLGDPKLGEEMLIYAENNYDQIIAERNDWRKNLQQ